MGWGYCNLGGGGSGGGLNLNIKIGSLDRRPAAGRQNDVFIVSDIPVKFYVMAAETPNSVPENTYWFPISATGENLLNLLKRNQLLLAIKGLYVFSKSAWSSLDAFIWDNGGWVQFSFSWNGELYTPGNEYVTITGGWMNETRKVSSVGNQTSAKLKISRYEDRIVFESTSSSQAGVISRPQHEVDMTAFSTLDVEFKYTQGTWERAAIVVCKNDTPLPYDNPAVKRDVRPASEIQKVTLDVEKLSGKYNMMLINIASAGGSYHSVWTLYRAVLK